MPEADALPLLFSFDTPPPVAETVWPALLGGKGSGLTRMRGLGLPVPPGFTLTTDACHAYRDQGWTEDLDRLVVDGIAALESGAGKRLGDSDEPLLVSVRSGAPVSMPGMMDTVLNVGMGPVVARGLCDLTGDRRFGWDTYHRFIEGYATIVGGADPARLGSLFADVAGVSDLDEVPTDRLEPVVEAWRAAVTADHPIPDDPVDQVRSAIKAVFESWDSDRAKVYRRRENIDESLGTAANVQAMVFGNLGSNSGTGVAFTRDPSTGDNGMIGDFMVEAQGEDVVAGTHVTESIADMGNRWPELARQLDDVGRLLERELADMVDIEFTIEQGKLWLLQSRVGKRTAQAALRIAIDLADDPDIPLDRAAAVARVAHLLDDEAVVGPAGHSTADEEDDAGPAPTVLAEGLGASPGMAGGVLSVDPDDAVRRDEAGEKVVLVRRETSPADVHGMAVAAGIVTSLGGMMSHAAVVARSWDLPAVVGVAAIAVDTDGISIGDRRIPVGSELTVDGTLGRVLEGIHRPARAEVEPEELGVLRRWRDESGGGPDDAPEAGRPGPVSAPPAGEVDDNDLLRALVLKGMATPDALAELLGATVEAASSGAEGLAERGLLTAGPGGRFLLTPDGTGAIDEVYRREAEIVGPVIERHLDRFHHLNHRFKEVVTAWQMREVDGQQVVNDHSDPDHDAAVVAALGDEIHAGIVPIIQAVAPALERLGRYEHRLAAALAAVGEGDNEMIAHPLRDSYHTVWFELHEELIRLSGRNRADEAAAGRA